MRRKQPLWLPASVGAHLLHGPHSPQHAVAPEKVMPQRRRRVYAGECEDGICQVPVDVLGRSEHRSVGSHAEIKVKHPEIEYTAVPDECHYAHDRHDKLLLQSVWASKTSKRAPRTPLGGAAMYRRSRFSYQTPVRVPRAVANLPM